MPPKMLPMMQGLMNAAPQEPDADEYGGMMGDQGQVPASDPSANYFPPDQGPFKCSMCQYFIGENQPCQKVSDPIQGEGCCNLFQKGGGGEAIPGANEAASTPVTGY